jgi:2,3-bisphosphoglycerate-independent phosphoglycerate mutase
VERVLLLFLDGVGVGLPDPDINPFFRADLPRLRRALGGRIPSLSDSTPAGPHGRAFPVDACLGVDGLPQSGTGQTALLTGHNAPRIFGRHFGPWVPVRLRPLLGRENLLVRAREEGRTVVFANAYPRGFPVGRRERRIAGVVAAALSAGVLDRDHASLASGEAVASEIVNDGWIEHLGHENLPRIGPEEAGANLARLARSADLTVFAHYLTDTVGHKGGMAGAVAVLERVDRFLGGVLDALDAGTTVAVFSDHGNVEDVRGGHTRNPALGLLLGGSETTLPEVHPPESLTGVRDFLSRLLGARG